MYRVRVLAREGEAVAEGRDVGAVVRERLRTARSARRAIGIPSAETDTYRCVLYWYIEYFTFIGLYSSISMVGAKHIYFFNSKVPVSV